MLQDINYIRFLGPGYVIVFTGSLGLNYTLSNNVSPYMEFPDMKFPYHSKLRNNDTNLKIGAYVKMQNFNIEELILCLEDMDITYRLTLTYTAKRCIVFFKNEEEAMMFKMKL